ncbi:hypothetical protein KY284_025651 [Solanum tuberosum]|nr:hypothetical protein KY284_025651 [Solanum tuberosum]
MQVQPYSLQSLMELAIDFEDELFSIPYLLKLQKEINDLGQGTLDVTGYHTKMKKQWEEMNTLDVNSHCTCVRICGGKTKMHKADQDRKILHFLMGLNEMYTVIRGNILMMATLPGMALASTILSQKERQREVKPHNHTALGYTSPNASITPHTGTRFKGFRTNYNSSKEGGRNSKNSNNNTVFRGNFSTRNKSILFCDFYKRTRHTKDRC